ncbi:FadR/GntR family transcriptional regulator [Kaistia dalseonensis]|uniref:Pyruvate dehydrogenase complex repressor n=1 Tax=Kaistia dalseonensis TaxID=410840 RepID=A0ABU0H998_9HYPH|nr:FadR/GntR family transcriptional regulator [Kaistia dalseonensis]MCX5495483.1 FadR/GntR family transcriptional regulator [Kaistia dalseonensis]MDQ0438074.1 GntR family transcriptional repressor for pyruvate dehydrogenase complex [Kaistia dalseonensis]
MVFQPVPSRATADEVARQIEMLVLEGVLHPGDRLPGERELATLLDVSRPILRDGLKALEARGLIESRHGGGTYVAAIEGSVFAAPIVDLIAHSPKASGDYLEFRREIDATAAAMAAARATEADRTIITRIFETMEAEHDKADFRREAALDVEFHQAIGEATHNIVMIHVLRACYRLLADGVFYNRSRLYGHAGSRDRLLAQHRAIRDAIVAGDADAAGKAATAHIAYVEAALREGAEAGARQEIASLRLMQFEERASARRGGRKAEATKLES